MSAESPVPSAEDIFSLNWRPVFVEGCLARVSSAAGDTVAVPRATFDRLMKIVDHAARLQNSASRPPVQMTVRTTETGFEIAADDPLTGAYSVSAPTLFEALAAAYDGIDSRIREFMQ